MQSALAEPGGRPVFPPSGIGTGRSETQSASSASSPVAQVAWDVHAAFDGRQSGRAGGEGVTRGSGTIQCAGDGQLSERGRGSGVKRRRIDGEAGWWVDRRTRAIAEALSFARNTIAPSVPHGPVQTPSTAKYPGVHAEHAYLSAGETDAWDGWTDGHIGTHSEKEVVKRKRIPGGGEANVFNSPMMSAQFPTLMRSQRLPPHQQ